MRREIRAGKWKKASCKRCSFFAFARGEIASKKELRRRRDLKRSPCGRCPSRAFLRRRRK